MCIFSSKPLRRAIGSSSLKVKKRRKVIRLPEYEADLLGAVKNLLDVFKNQGLLTYRRIHTQGVQVGGRFRKNVEMAGMEDLQIYLMHGKTLYRELKTSKGTQSPAQTERQLELTSLGHDYAVWKSIKEAVEDLRRRGLSVWAFP